MAEETHELVSRAEFEAYKKHVSDTILALHADHLAIVALIAQSRDVEKYAMDTAKTMFDQFSERMSAIPGEVCEMVQRHFGLEPPGDKPPAPSVN